MSAVTLSPNYIRKIAESYRLLRTDTVADRQVLTSIVRAADRCLRAHMRAQLTLTADVRLPLATVLQMLQYVHVEASARLAADVPTPVAMAHQPMSSTTKLLISRGLARLRELIAA